MPHDRRRLRIQLIALGVGALFTIGAVVVVVARPLVGSARGTASHPDQGPPALCFREENFDAPKCVRIFQLSYRANDIIIRRLEREYPQIPSQSAQCEFAPHGFDCRGYLHGRHNERRVDYTIDVDWATVTITSVRRSTDRGRARGDKSGP